MARELTIDEELAELERDLAERKKNYPALTIGPKPALKRDEAARRLARLESAINRLHRIRKSMEPPAQGVLFSEEL